MGELADLAFLFFAQVQGGQERKNGDAVVVVHQVLERLDASGFVVQAVAFKIFLLQFTKIEYLVAKAMAFFQQPEFAEVNVLGQQIFLSRNLFFGGGIGKKFFVKNG